MGFLTTYSSVSWTAGDVITEAKLDSMVANDQAYDSHAAQGLEFDEMAAPSTPAANKVRFYPKSDGLFYSKNDAGVETSLSRSIDGWTSANETWVYASATTITVPSGAASKYQKGDKVKLTQTTVKYFYIVGVADTVLTVTGGSDYTLVNAAISANFYSHNENPMGFPTWMNWVPTTYAWTAGTAPSGTPSVRIRHFWIKGNVCHVNFFETGYTAGATVTQLDFTSPVIGFDSFDMAWGTIVPANDFNSSTYVYGQDSILRICCASCSATGVRFMADYRF